MVVIKVILFTLLVLSSSAYIFAQQTIPEDTFITLERDAPFGSACPFYKLTISANGTVKLQPKGYNNHFREKIITGKIIKSKISKNQLKQLISEFENINFHSLKDTYGKLPLQTIDECPEILPDGATTFTSITINGKSKKIEHFDGCRGTEQLYNLTNLENKIDKIVNIKQWFDCYLGKNRINLFS